jgi:hypothetical protein
MPVLDLTDQELLQLQQILWQSAGMPYPPAITQPLLQKLIQAGSHGESPTTSKGNAHDSRDEKRHPPGEAGTDAGKRIHPA